MRIGALILAFVLSLACCLVFRSQLKARAAEKPSPQTCELEPSSKIDFSTQIKPIFEAKCQPCHFNGGTMYQRLPFDRPETIKTLGTKLLPRIKDENEQKLIREFLSQE